VREGQGAVAREGEGLAGAGDELGRVLEGAFDSEREEGRTELVPIMNLEKALVVLRRKKCENRRLTGR
jgi:hypothetical protein